jgi:tRNA(adenine34) deaminase
MRALSGLVETSVNLNDAEKWMRLALEEAEQAALWGEVPVGAVVVGREGEILGRGRNRREEDDDPVAHAEIEALRQAAKRAGTWRLSNATLFVTLEPCPMCAGALVNARIERVVYGCDDPKAGALRSLYTLGQDARLNHRFEVKSGVLAAQCARILSDFFAALRAPRT